MKNCTVKHVCKPVCSLVKCSEGLPDQIFYGDSRKHVGNFKQLRISELFFYILIDLQLVEVVGL